MLAGDILLLSTMYAMKIEVLENGAKYTYPFSEIGLSLCRAELGRVKAKAVVYKRWTREFVHEIEFDTNIPGIEIITLAAMDGLEVPSRPGLFDTIGQVMSGFDIYVLSDNLYLKLDGEVTSGSPNFVTEDGIEIAIDPGQDCMVYLYPKGIPTSSGHNYMADSEETTIGKLEEAVVFMANRAMWRALGTMIGLDGCSFDVVSPLLLTSCFLSK